MIIGKDRDAQIRDPQIVSLLSLIKAISSLIDSYISLLSLIKAILGLIDSYDISLLRLYFRGSLSVGPYLSL